MPRLYAFNVFNNAIFHHRISAFAGELQKQEVHCQQPRAVCLKPWIIDVLASGVLVLSRVDCGVSAVNKFSNVWKTNGRHNLHEGFGLRHSANFYSSEGSGPTFCYKHVRKAANRSPQAPSLHIWTWIYSAAHFASVEGAKGSIHGFIFNCANGKPPRPIGSKDGLNFKHGRFH